MTPYLVQLVLDPVDNEQMAWRDALTRNGQTLVGRLSRAAMTFLARHCGFEVTRFDWCGYFAEDDATRAATVDCDDGWRETFYLSR